MRKWDLTENAANELYADDEETPIRSLAISKSAKKLVAGTNNGICFIWTWDAEEQVYKPLQELIAHEGQYILKCQFSHDARYLATCSSDKTCAVWEISE